MTYLIVLLIIGLMALGSFYIFINMFFKKSLTKYNPRCKKCNSYLSKLSIKSRVCQICGHIDK